MFSKDYLEEKDQSHILAYWEINLLGPIHHRNLAYCHQDKCKFSGTGSQMITLNVCPEILEYI